eukprot:Sdes_comp20231_c0_seq1m13617
MVSLAGNSPQIVTADLQEFIEHYDQASTTDGVKVFGASHFFYASPTAAASCNLSASLNVLFSEIASCGKISISWSHIVKLYYVKIYQVINLVATHHYDYNPVLFEGESFEDLSNRILMTFAQQFCDSPPFTIQRLSEILCDSSMIHKSLTRLLRTLIRLVSVLTTTDADQAMKLTNASPTNVPECENSSSNNSSFSNAVLMQE